MSSPYVPHSLNAFKRQEQQHFISQIPDALNRAVDVCYTLHVDSPFQLDALKEIEALIFSARQYLSAAIEGVSPSTDQVTADASQDVSRPRLACNFCGEFHKKLGDILNEETPWEVHMQSVGFPPLHLPPPSDQHENDEIPF